MNSLCSVYNISRENKLHIPGDILFQGNINHHNYNLHHTHTTYLEGTSLQEDVGNLTNITIQ